MTGIGPGSFLEVGKILPLLIEESQEHPSFHVVAIGLPGYGFSEAPKKKGFGMTQYAEVRSSKSFRWCTALKKKGLLGISQTHARTWI